ncbi:MAG: ABC transporter permease [Clostridiales Family XIII bacterium]|jgi:ribose transport system permease protein|nr:ABC transporter permease [Clostridiales Family XIII bacterium]
MKGFGFNRSEILRQYGILFVLIAMFIIFSVATPNFLKVENLFNVARQVSMMGIAAVGMMFVMIAGGIDISIGSLLSFVNVFCAFLIVNFNVHPLWASLAAVAVASVGGFLNGVIVTQMKVPPLISTLAFMTIWEGIAFLISRGMTIFGLPDTFRTLGSGYVGPIPIPVIIMVVFLAFGGFFLNKTYIGRYFYAVGGNEEAAGLSGIHVRKLKWLVYTLCAAFTAVAGLVMLARLNAGAATTGKGFEFQVITAVVLGGVSIAGGTGRMFGVIIGILIMGFLSNGMVLLDVSEYVQRIIQGVVLVLAVGFDCLSKDIGMDKKGVLKSE